MEDFPMHSRRTLLVFPLVALLMASSSALAGQQHVVGPSLLATLTAALLLAASSAIDVPYLPQTDALCGGAAAAMVFRYWGDAHADAREFAPIVDRRAGGIATDVLTEAVRSRGWRTATIDG